MKRFLKRLLLFASVVFIPAALWTVFVVALDRASYVASLKMPEDASIVVCGDSQTKDALDPAYIPGFFNFSNAASLHDQNMLRLKDVFLANKRKVKVVLIDASPLKLGYNPSKPVSDTEAARVHFLIHVYHFGEGVRPVGSWIKLVRDVIFTRKFNEFRKSILRGKRWRSSLVGGFDPDKTHGFVNPRYRDKALADVRDKASRVNSLPPADGSEMLMDVLETQIDMVRAHGATPILTTMPLSGPLLKAVDPARLDAFSLAVRRLADRKGVGYIDCLRFKTDDSAWHDANHLNRDGAAAFSRAIVPLLRECQSSSPASRGASSR